MSDTCFLVIGMHRSGTSLLARLLEGLGFDLGTTPYPADRHNPRGYFEDRTCMEVQERILLDLRVPWRSAAGTNSLPPLWWRAPSMRPHIAELAAWLDRRLLAGKLRWALNDPRTTRFIPLWRELLTERGIRPTFLLAARHPTEVVSSEVTRDSVPTEQMLHIWLRHNGEALLEAADDLAGVFLYDRWFDDGERQLLRLAQATGSDPPRSVLEHVLASRLADTLYRQRAPNIATPDWACRVYDGLEDLADRLTCRAQQRLATEIEYIDAMLRQRERPRVTGELEAIVAPPDMEAEAWNLASGSLRGGRRPTVLFAAAAIPNEGAQPAGTATTPLEQPITPIEGSTNVRRAYQVWQWLSRRAFDTVTFLGGDGLATHCFDARRHGQPDHHGQFVVHYARKPAWLDDDGTLCLQGVRDIDAYYLEARTIREPSAILRGDAATIATLRAVLSSASVPQQTCRAGVDQVPAATPLVSVCIAHHERPSYLHDCLESVRALHYPDFECVLVDDGSTSPASVAFLESLEEDFDRRDWKLVRQENLYLGAARNAAARAAKGKYLFFLDDDNMVMPDGLDRAVSAAEHARADIVTAPMAKFSGAPGTRPARPEALWVFPGAAPLLGIFENCFGDANALVRRDAWEQLGGFSEIRRVGHEDWEFFAKAVLAGYRLEHCLTPVSWYRVHGGAMTRTGDWWRNYLRGLRPYRDANMPSLQPLPALAGILQRHIAALETSLAETEGTLAESRAQAEHLMNLIASGRQSLEATNTSLDAARTRIAALEQELNALYASRSWRVTAPLRAAKLGLLTPRTRNDPPLPLNAPVPPKLADAADSTPDDDPPELGSFSRAPICPQRCTRLHPDLERPNDKIDTSISIVIPTKDAGPEFSLLLRKLRNQKGVGSLEVILVDSGSTDNTVPTARQFGAQVIEIPSSDFSHSYARNLGARAATSDYLLFMVQDAMPIGAYWLHRMLRYLFDHADEDLVAVSCAEFSRTDSDVMYDHLAETHYRFLGCLDEDRLGRLAGFDNESLRRNGQLSDVASMISTDRFRSLEYRGDYGEDLDLGIRLIRSGDSVAMMASVKAIHSHNRPAHYHLKRCFVDVAFLKTNFDDFTIPPTLPLPGLIAGILGVGALVSERLALWTRSMMNRPAAEAMKRIFEDLDDYTPSAYVASDILFGDRRLSDFLIDIREILPVDESTLADETSSRAAQRFLDLFQGRLRHLADFLCRVFGPVDRSLAHEIQAAILKTYAASVGSAIGFACQESLDEGAEYPIILDRLSATLKSGV